MADIFLPRNHWTYRAEGRQGPKKTRMDDWLETVGAPDEPVESEDEILTPLDDEDVSDFFY